NLNEPPAHAARCPTSHPCSRARRANGSRTTSSSTPACAATTRRSSTRPSGPRRCRAAAPLRGSILCRRTSAPAYRSWFPRHPYLFARVAFERPLVEPPVQRFDLEPGARQQVLELVPVDRAQVEPGFDRVHQPLVVVDVEPDTKMQELGRDVVFRQAPHL